MSSCKTLKTNRIGACPKSNQINIHSSLDMNQKEIINKRLFGLEFNDISLNLYRYDSLNQNYTLYQTNVIDASNTVIYYNFNTLKITNTGGWSPTYQDTNTKTRLLIPYTGLYKINFTTCLLNFQQDNIGLAFISKNAGTGTTINPIDLDLPYNLCIQQQRVWRNFQNFNIDNLSCTVKLNQGDYINLGVVINNAATNGVSLAPADLRKPNFSIYLLQRD
jgi:hypothetical protein